MTLINNNQNIVDEIEAAVRDGETVLNFVPGKVYSIRDAVLLQGATKPVEFRNAHFRMDCHAISRTMFFPLIPSVRFTNCIFDWNFAGNWYKFSAFFRFRIPEDVANRKHYKGPLEIERELFHLDQFLFIDSTRTQRPERGDRWGVVGNQTPICENLIIENGCSTAVDMEVTGGMAYNSNRTLIQNNYFRCGNTGGGMVSFLNRNTIADGVVRSITVENNVFVNLIGKATIFGGDSDVQSRCRFIDLKVADNYYRFSPNAGKYATAVSFKSNVVGYDGLHVADNTFDGSQIANEDCRPRTIVQSHLGATLRMEGNTEIQPNGRRFQKNIRGPVKVGG